MPDITVPIPGTGAAPRSLKLPNAVELLLKEAKASFDGTASASAYSPTLELVDDAGNTVGSFPTDSSVAAGASADVSFFPKGKAPAAAAQLGSRIFWRGDLFNTGLSTITSGVETQLAGNGQTGPSPLDATTDVSFAGLPNFDTIRFSASPNPRAYLVRFAARWSDTPADYRYIRMGLAPTGGASNQLDLTIPLADWKPINETSKSKFQEVTELMPVFSFVSTTFFDVTFYALQSSGANKTLLWIAEVYDVIPNLVAP